MPKSIRDQILNASKLSELDAIRRQIEKCSNPAPKTKRRWSRCLAEKQFEIESK